MTALIPVVRRLLVLAVLAVGSILGGPTSRAFAAPTAGTAESVHGYDVSTVARVNDRTFAAAGMASDLLNGVRDESLSLPIYHPRPSTTPSVSLVATNTADDLVRFDPEWASRQIAGQNLPGSTGYATTPGGNTLSERAKVNRVLGRLTAACTDLVD